MVQIQGEHDDHGVCGIRTHALKECDEMRNMSQHTQMFYALNKNILDLKTIKLNKHFYFCEAKID